MAKKSDSTKVPDTPGLLPEGMSSLPRIMKPKHRILAAVFSRSKILSVVLDGLELFVKAGKIPLLGKLHPFTRPANNHFTNLPVNVDIPAEASVLPPEVARELIRKSKYHHVLNKCLCRHGRDCKKHTHDIGCIFLGQTGFDVTPGFSRQITMEEALEHVDKALADGLMPMTGRFRVDNYAFLVPDNKTLLGLCFCCSCCCFMSYYRHVPEERVKPIYPRLSGMEIKVTDKCKGCGACVETCYLKAIHVENGKAVHSDLCRGCGRCARTCQNGAVEVKVTDPNYFQKTVDEFSSLAKLD
jgi:UDP-glucose 4-epimerase